MIWLANESPVCQLNSARNAQKEDQETHEHTERENRDSSSGCLLAGSRREKKSMSSCCWLDSEQSNETRLVGEAKRNDRKRDAMREDLISSTSSFGVQLTVQSRGKIAFVATCKAY